MMQFLTSSFAKNIKHTTYFKTANQQQQQNPVNELSCTNLYALLCFLRTNICGSFFMVHGVHVKTFIETQNEASGQWTCIDTDKFTFVAAKKNKLEVDGKPPLTHHYGSTHMHRWMDNTKT